MTDDTMTDDDTGGVFSPRFRGFTIGILASVGAVAFESLGVATILPAVAAELGGLGGYGWGLSALMLANIVGTVVAGTDIDRRGPARTVLVGTVVFALGCLLAGLAPGWGVFIAARALQGLGIGAIMAYAYSLVGIAYPARLQAVMFAFLSSAWTIPSLIGPVFAGALTSLLDWRVVFWSIAPLTLVLLPLVLPGARRLSRPEQRSTAGSHRRLPAPVWFSILLAAGTGAVLLGLELDALPALVALVVGGLVGAVLALRWILPSGTLRFRRGAPVGIAIRFILCGVYFGSEAFLPLGLTSVHGLDVTLAGLGLAAVRSLGPSGRSCRRGSTLRGQADAHGRRAPASSCSSAARHSWASPSHCLACGRAGPSSAGPSPGSAWALPSTPRPRRRWRRPRPTPLGASARVCSSRRHSPPRPSPASVGRSSHASAPRHRPSWRSSD